MGHEVRASGWVGWGGRSGQPGWGGSAAGNALVAAGGGAVARRGAGAAALGADGRQLAAAQQTQGLTEAERQAVPLAAWFGVGGALRTELAPAPRGGHPLGSHRPAATPGPQHSRGLGKGALARPSQRSRGKVLRPPPRPHLHRHRPACRRLGPRPDPRRPCRAPALLDAPDRPPPSPAPQAPGSY